MVSRVVSLVLLFAGSQADSQLRGSANPTGPPATEDAPADVSPDETTDDVGPFLEEPTSHQDANPLPAKANWDNETGLKAAASTWDWGRTFCQSHHVGAFCYGYTRVRCCRNTFGYVRCGRTVHASTCGWHRGYGGGVWNAGSQDVSSAESPVNEDAPADAFADETTGYDEVGPFTEEPRPDQDANPLPAKANWDNETGLQAAAFNTWGRSFCEAHRVGAFCDGFTRVRCCRNNFGYVKCGSTVHASTCGWRGGGGYSGGGYSGGVWTIHPGWRQSSFCRAHHVGFFCYSHHKVHCCNDHGHFVECTTRSESQWRC